MSFYIIRKNNNNVINNNTHTIKKKKRQHRDGDDSLLPYFQNNDGKCTKRRKCLFSVCLKKGDVKRKKKSAFIQKTTLKNHELKFFSIVVTIEKVEDRHYLTHYA